MRPVVHVAKTDHSPLGLRSGHFNARRPVGLENQSHGTGRHVMQEFFNKRFDFNTLLPGHLLLHMSKLL
jgi:hypothetical protein